MRNYHNDMFTQRLNDPDSALVAAAIPASGSFIHVGEHGYCAFIIYLGAVDAATVFEVQQASAIDGALKSLDPAVTLTIAGTDDDTGLVIEFKPEQLDLANNYQFVSLVPSTVGTGDGFIVFQGWNNRRQPVVQPANFVAHVDALEALAALA